MGAPLEEQAVVARLVGDQAARDCRGVQGARRSSRFERRREPAEGACGGSETPRAASDQQEREQHRVERHLRRAGREQLAARKKELCAVGQGEHGRPAADAGAGAGAAQGAARRRARGGHPRRAAQRGAAVHHHRDFGVVCARALALQERLGARHGDRSPSRGAQRRAGEAYGGGDGEGGGDRARGDVLYAGRPAAG